MEKPSGGHRTASLPFSIPFNLCRLRDIGKRLTNVNLYSPKVKPASTNGGRDDHDR
jgi:hypothetical protein